MTDIDEVLAAAIRTTFLQLNGPASRLPQHIEMAIAQRIRAALEQEGVYRHPRAQVTKRREIRRDKKLSTRPAFQLNRHSFRNARWLLLAMPEPNRPGDQPPSNRPRMSRSNANPEKIVQAAQAIR